MYNILIVGVGGQGSLLASRVLGNLLLGKGLDVKVNEVHGMSQRGGSVVTTVRAGENVASPLIEVGEADILISFEQLEALRWAYYLKKGGHLVSSSQKILPMPVIVGAEKYPEFRPNGLWIDAVSLALEAGNVKAANIVMLGAASTVLEFTLEDWSTALAVTVPQKVLEINQKAFLLGRKAVLGNDAE